MFIWDGHALQLAVGLSYNQLNEGRVTKSLIQVFAKHSSEPPRVPRNRGTGGTFSQSVSQKTLADFTDVTLVSEDTS